MTNWVMVGDTVVTDVDGVYELKAEILEIPLDGTVKIRALEALRSYCKPGDETWIDLADIREIIYE